jgi:CTD small phosphatase-like protein 2
MGNVLTSQLGLLKNKVDKTAKKSGGIDSYIVEEDDSDSNDSFEAAQTGGSIMDNSLNDDPSKLIDLELINLLKYCKELMLKKDDEDYQEEVMMKSIELGKKTAPKLLIFDMDETLVAAKFKGNVPDNFNPTFSYDFEDTTIHVRCRPYLQDALEKLAQLYEIIVFTAGTKAYADHILDYIDPKNTIFKRRLYRTDCILVEQFFIKDLDIILDRERSEMIIVDNSILAFAFDLDNGVPINSYMGTEPDDKELLFLYSFLEEVASAKDVRKPIADSFRLSYLQSTIEASSTAKA